MATTRIKDLSKTATTVNSDANLVLDGNTGGTQKISRDNFRQDTADAFVAAPGTYNLAPLNSGTGKIDAVYLSSSSDTPKGAWDASSNTPTLADGSGTAGDYYDVTVAGSSDLGSGSIAFTVGDVVKYNGTVWFKIDSVANILDGVSTIDGAKTAIEIPDVGTAPNEVPLNGMLGSMAFQSSEGISVGTLEADGKTTLTNDSDNALVVETTNQNPMYVNVVGSAPNYLFDVRDDDTSKFRVDGSGNVKLSGDENELQFHSDTGVGDNVRARIQCEGKTGTYGYGGDLVFKTTADNNTSAERVRITSDGDVGLNFTPVHDATRTQLILNGTWGGKIVNKFGGSDSSAWYANSSNYTYFGTAVPQPLILQTNGTERWKIDGTNGNLIANGTAIDFGSVAGGTGTPTPTTGGLLNDYESGTWTPTYAPQSGSFTSITMNIVNASYTKIGNLVTAMCYVNTTGTLNTTGGSGRVLLSGLPFTISSGYASASVGYAANWTNHPAGAYTELSGSSLSISKRSTSVTGNLTGSDVADLDTSLGSKNLLMLSITYQTTD